MQNSFDKYRQYSTTDFALDNDFINWVLFPDEGNDASWDEFIFNTPEQKKNIDVAKNMILSFDTSAEKISDDIKNRIWQLVILKAENVRVVRMNSRKLWMAAASVLIMLVAEISYFYINRNEYYDIPF